ncbi:MAG: polysaccharide deacetylase family protein [Glaciimonas sp.]|nr:polysaccharide deacetylase family protein [Glaciimonas sp.]
MTTANLPVLETSPFYLGRALLHSFSPGKSRGLSILIYHRVLAKKDPLFPEELDAVEFDNQIRMLKSCFKVIPLIDAVRYAKAGTLPPRVACITFDDGYADNVEVALPILRRHGVSATFFVATGFLDGGRMWNDTIIELVRGTASNAFDATSLGLGFYPIITIQQRQVAISSLIRQLKYLSFEDRATQVNRLCEIDKTILPSNLMMNSYQVRELRDNGMDIGGHTVRHPILARLPPMQARDEILHGKERLQEIIGEPVRLFAYPNGKPKNDYKQEHVEMVRKLGFEAAVTTSWGAQKQIDDLFQLPRFTPWDQSRLRFILRFTKNLVTEATLA